MLLADAEKLANELMAQFGLTPVWHFEFDEAVRRFGACHWNTHKITLSRELTLRNEREKVEDTIRHEIAHALCKAPIIGRGWLDLDYGRRRGVRRERHGAEWKRMCKITGAKPERCYSHDDVDAPKGDWTATCRGCGRVHHKFRQPKRELYCAAKDCKRQNPPEWGQGRFNPICKLVWRHKNALPDPSEAQRKKAIEAMKARLRAQEPESRAASDVKPFTEPSGMMQCVSCDARSLGCKECPGCGGELKLERVLQAEKEQLKKRIAELEAKVKK
jgi:predicted SprT family Zn-dependent metalloprotease